MKSTSRQSKDGSTNDWPELAPVRPGATPGQALAKEIVKIQGENSGKLLVSRSRSLMAVTIIMFLSVILGAFYTVPTILAGETNGITLIFILGILFQLSSASYFMKAKDPELASQILRLLLILHGLALLLGFAQASSLFITFSLLVLIYTAYRRMEQLKYGGD